MSNNNLDQFREVLRCAGIVVDDIIADGELHRCGTVSKPSGKDAAYIVHDDELFVGWWCNWVTGEKGSWIPNGQTQSANMRERVKQVSRKGLAEREKGYRAKAEEARRIYAKLPEACSTNRYLKKKQVGSVSGLKAYQDDLLVVPVQNALGHLQSLQFVGDTRKTFLAGGKVAGGFFLISGSEEGALYIVEGVATGLSVHAATGATVWCALFAGNILNVAKAAKERYSSREIVVAGDNDLKREQAGEVNVGKTKAAEAARAIQGKWIVPHFEQGSQLSDFNDLHVTAGLDAVKRRLKEAKSGDLEISTSYPTPVKLDSYIVPSFESDMIPGPLAQICAEISEAIQVPEELALASALAAVSTVVQGKARVLVENGYSEPLNVFQICALPPGQRKSSVVKFFKDPIVHHEKEMRQKMSGAVEAACSERETMQLAISAIRKKVAKAKDADERKAIIEEVRSMEKEVPKIPIPPRFFVDDITPEALGELMKRHGEKLSIFEAEAGIIDILCGRYSGKANNLDLVLKAWGQEAYNVDRRHGEPIQLEAPSLTLALCPQPSVISGIEQGSALRGRGLVGRILFWLPVSRLGYRKKTRTIDEKVKIKYWDIINNLLCINATGGDADNDGSGFILLSKEAKQAWERYQEEVEVNLREGEKFEEMTDWAGKLPGQVIRLAGLFHCTIHQDPFSTPISAELLTATANIANILAVHTMAALNLMGLDPKLECAKKIWKWLKRDRVEKFTGKQALEKVKGKYKTMREVNPGLEVLIDYGLIIRLERQGNSQPYIVNPLALEGGN